MGWTSLFGANNPLAQYAQQNQRTLGAIGAGLASGQNFSDGLSAAAQAVPAGRTADDAYATAMAEKAKTEADTQRSMRFLQEKAPKFFEAVQAGVMTPGAAWDEVMKASQPKLGEAFTLGAGETRYGPDGSVLAQGAPDTKDAFGNEKDLATQYNSQDPVKTYQAVRNSYERVRSAAEMGNTNADGSGAADISLVFAYMKMLDPTSVVREGEVATANSAGGVPASVLNMYNNLVKGDKLTPQVRGQFVQSADAIYKDTENNLRDANGQFTTRAQGWNVDPNNFIIQPEAYPAFAQPGGGDIQSLLDKYP